jgi:hypothetical protein
MRQTGNQDISECLHAKVEPTHGAAKNFVVAEITDETKRVLGAQRKSRGNEKRSNVECSCLKVHTLDFKAVETTAIQLG